MQKPSGGIVAAIIFDLDGTLLDSAPDIHAALNAALAPYERSVSLEQARGFIGRGAPVLVSRARAALDLDDSLQDPILADFLDRYETAVALTQPYPGALAALDTVAARGHTMAICTNKPIGPARFVAAHFGLDTRMGAMFGGDSLATRKPDPEMLHATMAALEADTCLYVGDSETDCETARAADVPFVLFTEGYRHSPPEALPHAAAFSDWSQFPDLAERVLMSG
ncbi:phosphoglycolate phosphatase [Palleronia salina]|uniref:Phosphoglycolate phosphatase n=1 Tax=Palleronia salina TaxID=313368 RepID=A0A1M6KBM0_9RHOB|nr:phosphoglycolate phosphatase [Palleronia salina]SHJ56267.1 phosphoglycolate phosphatase [Palleronia salina]